MRFDIPDVARAHSGPLERPGDQPALRLRIGHRVPVSLATVIDTGGTNDAIDVIAVALGLRQRLEQHTAHTFPGNNAVTAVAETAAAAVTREEPPLRQPDVLIGVQRQVHAAGEGHLALTTAQALARQVQRRQRRGTLRVNGQTRPLEVADKRHPVRDTRRASRGGHRRTIAARLKTIEGILLVHHADKHADRLGLRQVAAIPGVFECVPRRLKEQALLGIEHFRFARRDIEEPRIKRIHIVEEPTPLAASAADTLPGRIVVLRMVPARRRNLGDAVTTVREVRP